VTQLLLLVNDLDSMARFYSGLLKCDPSETDDDFVHFSHDCLDLVLHAIPAEYREALQSPPALREDSAWKPTFEVTSIDECRAFALRLGGLVKPAGEQWEMHGHVYCNAHDPEGNVIQLRERVLG